MTLIPEDGQGGRLRRLRDSLGAHRQAAGGLVQRAGEIAPAQWVRDYLSQHPMPAVPVQGQWEFSASALIGPHVPRGFRLGPKVLDVFGRIRFSPYAVAIDQRTDIPWADVVEIRTRPLLDVVTVDFIEQVTNWLRPLIRTPGLGAAAGFLAGQVPELVLSIVRVAVGDDSRIATLQVPVEIDYATGRRKNNIKTMSPSILSSTVLAFPQVARSLLATASWHQVPIRPEAPRTNATAEQAAYLLSDRIRRASEHLRSQPPTPELAAETPEPDVDFAPPPRSRPRTPYTGQT